MLGGVTLLGPAASGLSGGGGKVAGGPTALRDTGIVMVETIWVVVSVVIWTLGSVVIGFVRSDRAAMRVNVAPNISAAEDVALNVLADWVGVALVVPFAESLQPNDEAAVVVVVVSSGGCDAGALSASGKLSLLHGVHGEWQRE